MSGNVISLKRLAAAIQMDRSAARRYVLSLGIVPVKRRTGDSGYQTALTFTQEQFVRVCKARIEDGYLPPSVLPQEDQAQPSGLSGFSTESLIEELMRRFGA